MGPGDRAAAGQAAIGGTVGQRPLPRAPPRNEADRSIENTDVVLWYVFGLPHITWPVMPADIVSFWLKAVRFLRPQPVARRAAKPPPLRAGK
jgi:copper amine oxidase-like protein